MRTQAIADCRYCPDPRRVAATSGALTLHVVAFLFFLVPISVVQIPKLLPPKPKDTIEGRFIPKEEPPKPVPVELPPPPKPRVRPTTAIPQQTPFVVDKPREIDTYVEQPANDGIDTVEPIRDIDIAPPPGDVEVIATFMPPPPYPRAELARGIEGIVEVRVRVGVDGSPVLIKLGRSSGNVNLDRAALDGARKWRFEPAVRNGTAVEVETTVPVRFSVLPN